MIIEPFFLVYWYPFDKPVNKVGISTIKERLIYIFPMCLFPVDENSN